MTRPELLPGRGLVGLLEHRADGRRDHAPRASAGTRSWALRVKWTRQRCQRGAQQLLPDRLHEAPVVVADDQAHARQAALDEPPDERRPGRALVVARGELEAQDPPLAGQRDPGRHERRHGHHPARPRAP